MRTGSMKQNLMALMDTTNLSQMNLPGRGGRRRAQRAAVACGTCVFLLSAALVQAAPPTFADTNGDGYGDVLVGLKFEEQGAAPGNSGALQVFFGGALGVTASTDQLWSQNSTSMLDSCELEDFFGAAVASGDFDGDGYADAIIGIPYENISAANAGAVSVMYGSAAGLSASRDQFISQNTTGIDDASEKDDWFGNALVCGDFDGDGYDDAAIGIDNEKVGTAAGAGAVQMIYGTSTGLSATGDQWITQNTNGILDSAEADDSFGYALAAGDFDGDGFEDLAVGVVAEDVGALTAAGAVNVIYGTSAGLAATGNQYWTQDSSGIAGSAESVDYFGWSVTAGDFNGDGYCDLAVGVPYEDVGAAANAGAVNVIYGSASGLTSSGNQLWTQDSTGINGTAETDDHFGYRVVAGDFDGDGYVDLAIDVLDEAVGALASAGGVNIIYGSAAGLSSARQQLWTQDASGVQETAEAFDRFGNGIAVVDVNGDGQDDLIVGASGETVNGVQSAGAFHVLLGGDGGLTSTGNQYITQDTTGVEDSCENVDYFGTVMGTR